jgi:hypothetical protein
MEFLWGIGIFIYIAYSIVKAFGKTEQVTPETELAQPKRNTPKSISTPEGIKTLEEIIAEALKKSKQKNIQTIEIQEPSKYAQYESPETMEVINYEDIYAKRELDRRRPNEDGTEKIEKTTKKFVKREIKRNTKKRINIQELREDSESLKKAFIYSEIFKRKYE